MTVFDVMKETVAIKRNVLLSPYTTWKVGGNAEYFWEPREQDLENVLRHCQQTGTPVYYLGRGSNVLIDDSGLSGLTICTRRTMQIMQVQRDVLMAEAGVPLPKLAKFAADAGIRGFEFLIGIPGTVGAGVAMNAGLSAQLAREIKDVLIQAEVVTLEGQRLTIAKDDLGLVYRGSGILANGYFVVRAFFKIGDKAPPHEIRQTMAEHLAERKRKQPISKSTAGSTFKQPAGGKPAGWYIDQAGLKGYQIGGAVVSRKHANWIENCGHASADDIKRLIKHIQEIVLARFDVVLQEEVSYLPTK